MLKKLHQRKETMINDQDSSLTKPQDFTDFKKMYDAGPSYLTGEFPKGKVNVRTLTGACERWNQNTNNLVSLDLKKHEYYIDIYGFLIYSLTERKMTIVGWMFFDDLLGKATEVIEDGTIYLTIPIRELRSPGEMTNLMKSVKADRRGVIKGGQK